MEQPTTIEKTGVSLIAQERTEQVEKHERTIRRDLLQNADGQLALAASMLTLKNVSKFGSMTPKNWDQKLWNKMLRKPHEKRLIIAGALIAAELDRLLALEMFKTSQN